MEFKVGDKAVYPGHGVGVVKAVETIDIGEERTTMYVLKILDNGVTVHEGCCRWSWVRRWWQRSGRRSCPIMLRRRGGGRHGGRC